MQKSFVDDSVALVDSACHGLVSLSPGLGYDAENSIVLRRARSCVCPRVTLISGGDAVRGPTRDRILTYLDAPSSPVGWTPSIPSRSWEVVNLQTKGIHIASKASPASIREELPCDEAFFKQILMSVYESLSQNEAEITQFDALVGDGDCGTTLVSGALALVEALPQMRFDSLTCATQCISEVICQNMGGTSGALYGILFTAFAIAVRDLKSVTVGSVASAAVQALFVMRHFTAASVGDRTMMDALIPFVETFSQYAQAGESAVCAMTKAVDATTAGACRTSGMASAFGYSTYVGVANEGNQAVAPIVFDPGALGVVAIVQGILDAVNKSL